MEYTSLDEKVDVFADPGIENSVGKLYCIDTMQEFNTFRNSVSMKGMIFRGMNEAKYKIFSSLQRRFQLGAINSKTYPTLFSFMDREIQDLKDSTVLPEYYKSLGTPVTDYLYMSFLQHYSAPTSLIDFSESLDVALYFATRDVEYSYPTNSKDISNYVSLYWIEEDNYKTQRLHTLLEEQCIDSIKTSLDKLEIQLSQDKSRNDNEDNKETTLKIGNVEEDSKQIREILESNISYSLKFQSLKDVHIGFIAGNNEPVSRQQSIFEKQYYNNLYTATIKFYGGDYKLTYEQWLNCISVIFKQSVVITNLNQVAQHGCFIHFTPQNVETALEEYVLPSSNSKLKIHCINIHKSLCPCILKGLYIDGQKISPKRLFPEPTTMASGAYISTIERE